MIARVDVFVPGPGAPCMLCGWTREDFASQHVYPCRGGGPAPTGAHSFVGAAGAALIAAELRKLINRDAGDSLSGCQVLVNLAYHRQLVTRFTFNPHCRFDHAVWQISRLQRSPDDLTLAELCEAVSGSHDRSRLRIRVPGHAFTRIRYCPGCRHHARTAPRLARRVPASQRACPACGAATVTRGFDMHDELPFRWLRGEEAALPLADLGIVDGDIVAAGVDGRWQYFEVGRWAAAASRQASPDAPVAPNEGVPCP